MTNMTGSKLSICSHPGKITGYWITTISFPYRGPYWSTPIWASTLSQANIGVSFLDAIFDYISAIYSDSHFIGGGKREKKNRPAPSGIEFWRKHNANLVRTTCVWNNLHHVHSKPQIRRVWSYQRGNHWWRTDSTMTRRKKDKRTNNDLQNIHIKLKIE
jgi:hypothetical protein